MSQSVRRSRVTRPAVVLGTAAVLALGGSLPLAQAEDASTGHGNQLRAWLTGEKEVPGPGDADGLGTARVTLSNSRVCFELTWRNIDGPTAAHVHVGGPRTAGPVVIGLLSVPAPGLGAPVSSVGGCADADPALVRAIRQHPRNYYVNIHNVAYPGGAVRGQLHS